MIAYRKQAAGRRARALDLLPAAEMSMSRIVSSDQTWGDVANGTAI
jgi:hypothetical protein